MKTINILFAGFILSAVFAFIPPKYDLIGHWMIYGPDSVVAYVEFTRDGQFKVTGTNGEAGDTGSYKLNDSTFSIKNAKGGCGRDYWGTYKLTFYGRDSVLFAVMNDSCTGRREEIVGGNPGLRRLKKK